MKRSLLASIAVLPLFAIAVIAQTTVSKSESTGTTITGPSRGVFFALSVADVRTVSLWYQEKLGFRVLTQGEAPNKIGKFAILEGDGAIIEIVQHRDAKPRSAVPIDVKTPHFIHGIFKMGMVVRNLDIVYQEIKKRGVTIMHDLMSAKDIKMRSFIILDTEGNMIQFFGD